MTTAGRHSPATRLGFAGAAVVGVAFGMGRYAFGLTLPDLRADPSLTATGLPDVVLGLIAGGTFAGFLGGILGVPLVAGRLGSRAPTTVGGVCGTVGALLVALAPDPVTLAVGAVLAGSAAGWVWAPYSDLVAATAPPAARPRLLALVSTGTSAGLVLVGVVALAAAGVAGGWRAVWVAVGACSAAAALLNLRWTPRPRPGRDGPRTAPALRALAWPAVYAVTYQAACAVSFTYAVDAVRRAGLAAGVGPLLYVLVGVVGLVGLGTGTLATRLGTTRVATGCLASVGLSLVLLALGGGTLTVALVSAAVFAPGYMVGAAVLAVWTTEIAPGDPARALTATLVVGALGAVAAPVVVGALVGPVGLPVLLVATGAVTVAVGLALPRRVRP